MSLQQAQLNEQLAEQARLSQQLEQALNNANVNQNLTQAQVDHLRKQQQEVQNAINEAKQHYQEAQNTFNQVQEQHNRINTQTDQDLSDARRAQQHALDELERLEREQAPLRAEIERNLENERRLLDANASFSHHAHASFGMLAKGIALTGISYWFLTLEVQTFSDIMAGQFSHRHWIYEFALGTLSLFGMLHAALSTAYYAGMTLQMISVNLSPHTNNLRWGGKLKTLNPDTGWMKSVGRGLAWLGSLLAIYDACVNFMQGELLIGSLYVGAAVTALASVYMTGVGAVVMLIIGIVCLIFASHLQKTPTQKWLSAMFGDGVGKVDPDSDYGWMADQPNEAYESLLSLIMPSTLSIDQHPSSNSDDHHFVVTVENPLMGSGAEAGLIVMGLPFTPEDDDLDDQKEQVSEIIEGQLKAPLEEVQAMSNLGKRYQLRPESAPLRTQRGYQYYFRAPTKGLALGVYAFCQIHYQQQQFPAPTRRPGGQIEAVSRGFWGSDFWFWNDYQPLHPFWQTHGPGIIGATS